MIQKAKPRVGQRGAAEIRSASADQSSEYHHRPHSANVDPLLSISDGQTSVGHVFSSGSMFDATTADGELIGTFTSAREAVSAIQKGRRR